MERYDTRNHFHAWYEHWHRYHWVTPFISEKIVADVACGNGYGSALMAQQADYVYGVDINQEVIEQAGQKYPSSNIAFKHANALKTPLTDQSVDVVVSFETLEHLSEQEQLMNEFKRIMKPQGLAVISTPDKAIYSGNVQHNEHHEKELDVAEFSALIEGHFSHVVYFGQELQTSSFLAPLKSSVDSTQLRYLFVEQGNELKLAAKQSKPTYLIAVASDNLQSLQPFMQCGSSCLNDVKNSLYTHYNKQIAKFMSTDQKLFEANKEIDLLQKQVQQQSMVISQLQARLGL